MKALALAGALALASQTATANCPTDGSDISPTNSELAGALPVQAGAIRDSGLLAGLTGAVSSAESEWREGVREDNPTGARAIGERYGLRSGLGRWVVEHDADWCGAFVSYAMLRAGMNSSLYQAFLHVDNVEALFTYGQHGIGYGQRIPDRISDGGHVVSMRAYHQALGQSRTWTDRGAVRLAGAQGHLERLGFQPGDVALIDHENDGKADHIALIRSWDPTTGILETIEGNVHDGFSYDPYSDDELEHDSVATPKKTGVFIRRYNLRNAADLATIYGVGRLSAQDFSGRAAIFSNP